MGSFVEFCQVLTLQRPLSNFIQENLGSCLAENVFDQSIIRHFMLQRKTPLIFHGGYIFFSYL